MLKIAEYKKLKDEYVNEWLETQTSHLGIDL